MHTESGLAANSDNEAHIAMIEITPRQSQRVILGVFEEGIDAPRYNVDYQPNITDAISYKRIITTKAHENVLSFYFTNYSDTTIRITLTERDV